MFTFTNFLTHTATDLSWILLHRYTTSRNVRLTRAQCINAYFITIVMIVISTSASVLWLMILMVMVVLVIKMFGIVLNLSENDRLAIVA